MLFLEDRCPAQSRNRRTCFLGRSSSIPRTSLHTTSSQGRTVRWKIWKSGRNVSKRYSYSLPRAPAKKMNRNVPRDSLSAFSLLPRGKSLHVDHFSYRHKRIQSRGKRDRRHPAKIHARGPCRFPWHFISARCHFTITQNRRNPPEKVEDLDRHPTAFRNRVANQRRRIERIGIILMQHE